MKATEHRIDSTEDVKTFFEYLMKVDNIALHPDTPFSEYTDDNGEPFYSEQDAEKLDALMHKCFSVCEQAGTDPYEIGLPIAISTIQDRFNND